MEKTPENKTAAQAGRPSKHINVGLLAHVDAGKTTLAEGILYSCGAMRTLGRVDHGDTVLDNFALERSRGITIFSKQARARWREMKLTLLDTPGHVDFSAEMERTLQVMDYAVLVISGADGVQGHVETLWRLLKRYELPVFLFVNKMDQPGTEKEGLLGQLQQKLHENCVEFGGTQTEPEFWETLSLCSEPLLEQYLERGSISEESISEAIRARQIFPCYFGSALRLEGVEALLEGLYRYTKAPVYGEEFGARVYKIARDSSGVRLTYLKVTGGVLRVKMPVSNRSSAGEGEVWEEKADQLRLYTGGQYQTVQEAEAGEICAVTGLTKTFAGQGLGAERKNEISVLEPVMTYQIFLPQGTDIVKALLWLRQLEEEEPQLHIVWKEALSEIHVQVMGEVQMEILRHLIKERFGLETEFGPGSIVYKETILEPVIGIGHFEPLRHYAEVHLLLEPGERGSGLQFLTACSEDMLDGSWQRQILSCLEEKTHIGVLTGSEITDMRITLLAGRAHQKHTEGGDFRQAACRALRNGLRKARCLLLEPYFSFTLEVPLSSLGRAMSDIQRMNGSFEHPLTEGETGILTGSAPVASLQDYQREVSAYTGGRGRLSCILKGYEPCHNPQEVIKERGYDCEGDLENPTGSVFCAHGAGFVVSWDKVEEYAHVDSGFRLEGDKNHTMYQDGAVHENSASHENSALGAVPLESRKREEGREKGWISQEEIEEIFRQTYGAKSEDINRYRRYHRTGSRGGASTEGERSGGEYDSRKSASHSGGMGRRNLSKEQYLLVDGYNIIFAWEELRSLAAVNIDSARDRLMDIMSNYQGYLGNTLILVFDAYKVKGNPGKIQKYHNIYVVYTKEAETADQYIEKTVHDIGKKHQVTVATSDALEQMIIWGDGAIRLSAQGLLEAVEQAARQLREQYIKED